ncbi:sensor histidine kinase [Chondromyces apiculatus]|uniref:histidine kinase n=1 Tax=Chondromyces apiculatus DSM 436 TaxID=1192034 RepID=A0A017TDG1_9BACT|nr:ATP-binding protein [Chondromyces apiculatus]EYF06621.1 sensor histidine kinase [Chondromyces apiculatus DSM 436]
MRLAVKLALALIPVMCVVLGLYGWLSVRRERALFEADIRRDEHMVGMALRAAVVEVWRRDGQEKALSILDDASARNDGLEFRWVWPEATVGDRFAPSLPPAQLGELFQGTEVVRLQREGVNGGRFYTYIPVTAPMGATGKIGAIEISESLAEEEHYVEASVGNTAFTILALALLSGMLAMLLGGVLVGRPTKRLVDKARRIGEGDLSGPLLLSQRDELGLIATEINAMCEHLAEARERAERETAARSAAMDQLRHADRLNTVGKLASGIAHELGTPLNVVGGRAKMIARGLAPEEVADSARIIAEQADRMARIIRQLLDFARRRGPQKASMDLTQLARQTLSLLEPLARKGQVTLQVDAPEGEVRAEVDPGQMQQVLTNLVVNGIQAMKKGGALSIRVERTEARPPADHGGAPGEYVALRVIDAGEGIPVANMPRLFEPFFTTKDIGEGTGLGLSVTYGIVQEHGGWIDVVSEVEKGSMFTVFLAPERASR